MLASTSMRIFRFVVLLLAGCQASVASGSSCARNSDCAELLACAAGRCRAACGDARDCGAGESCVAFRGSGVCVPPSQPVPCVFNTDCGAHLFCHSGVCVAQCMTDHDCDHGTCVEMLCSEPKLTASATDAGPVDGGASDAGAQCPARQVRCQTDGLCHDLTSLSACGQCGVHCPPGGACEAGACVCGGRPCAPGNDHCVDATEIMLDANGLGSGRGTLSGATADLAPCFGIGGADIFFRVHVPTRSVLSATSDTNLDPDIMDRGCGLPSSACGSVCSRANLSIDVAVVDAGDVVIALRADQPTFVGLATLEVSVVPIGDLDISALVPNVAVSTPQHPAASATLAPTTRNSGCGTGNAHAFYWVRCGGPSSSLQETVTACLAGGTGMVLEDVTTPRECTPAAASGCVTVSSNAPDYADIFVVHAATGTARIDVQLY